VIDVLFKLNVASALFLFIFLNSQTRIDEFLGSIDAGIGGDMIIAYMVLFLALIVACIVKAVKK